MCSFQNSVDSPDVDSILLMMDSRGRGLDIYLSDHLCSSFSVSFIEAQACMPLYIKHQMLLKVEYGPKYTCLQDYVVLLLRIHLTKLFYFTLMIWILLREF